MPRVIVDGEESSPENPIKITVDVKIKHIYPERGVVYQVTCPNCYDKIECEEIEFGIGQKCSCGLYWVVQLSARAL